jgi:hypothetical protein
MVHYAGGKLTQLPLPVNGQDIAVEAVAHIPGTTQALAGGFTHAPHNPGTHVVGVILQYR